MSLSVCCSSNYIPAVLDRIPEMTPAIHDSYSEQGEEVRAGNTDWLVSVLPRPDHMKLRSNEACAAHGISHNADGKITSPSSSVLLQF